MMKTKTPSKSVRAKIFFARAKYVYPLLSALLVLLLCFVPCVEFRNDDTAREPQSILGNAALAEQSYKTVLSAPQDKYEQVDIGLAQDTRVGVIALRVVLWVMMILSALLFGLALWCWRYPAGTIEADRARVWARFFLPGRWVHFLITLLPLLPTVYPYYILNRFEEYYRVKPTTDPNAVAEYYEYSIVTHPINPLVVAAVLVAVGVVLFLVAADWEKVWGVDLFTDYYRPEPEQKAGRRGPSDEINF